MIQYSLALQLFKPGDDLWKAGFDLNQSLHCTVQFSLLGHILKLTAQF